jgi:hypothetical protein
MGKKKGDTKVRKDILKYKFWLLINFIFIKKRTLDIQECFHQDNYYIFIQLLVNNIQQQMMNKLM